jgi:RNA polymerase sigma-70 factor (ECF subfamily)
VSILNKSSQARPAVPEASGQVEQLFRAHGGWLVSFLRRRFGHEAADDLAQETFLRVVRGEAQPRSPKAFLATVALNAARDLSRRRAARPRLVDGEGLPEPGAPATQAEAVLLKEVVFGLPDNLKAVFLLSRFGGLTYEEIAEQCGVSVKTVEARMTRALKLCAERLRG